MGGVTLSRWTLSYFAAALAALVTAEGLMAAGYGFPARPILAPETFVLVHVVALGWLSLLMIGALFQFVPVLVARRLHSNSLPLPTLLLLLAGLASLIAGFLDLSRGARLGDAVFPLAAALLTGGFALALWNLARTLWTARPLTLPARFVVVGLLSVTATVLLGVIFSLVLSGLPAPSRFVALTSLGVPIHTIAGLGGWLTFTAMGVSYRLLAMFMLSRELQGPSTRAVLYLGAGALAVAIVGGAVAVYLGGGVGPSLGVAGLLGLAALVLYGRDVARLYRARKRRALELNSRMSFFAMASLAAAVLLIAVLLALGALGSQVGAVVFLVGFGWLTGLGLAQLYKIVAFLTWLECYGPVLGKTATPRVQDLVVEGRAAKWFWLYFLAVWAATGSLFAGFDLAFRAAAGGMLVATGGIIVELVRIRRLADVKAAMRFPEGARRPSLLYSSPQQA